MSAVEKAAINRAANADANPYLFSEGGSLFFFFKQVFFFFFFTRFRGYKRNATVTASNDCGEKRV